MRIYRYGELVQTRTVTGTSHTERGPEDAGLLWGMYTVKVAAVSANGVAGEEATAGPLMVGKPGKLAAAPATQGGIGNLTLTWLPPDADPDPASTLFYAMVGGRSKASRPGQVAVCTAAGGSWPAPNTGCVTDAPTPLRHLFLIRHDRWECAAANVPAVCHLADL